MAATDRTNFELKRKVNSALQQTDDPIEKLRLSCLSRGVGGLRSLGKTFQIFNNEQITLIDFNDFKKGLRMFGIHMDEVEVLETFQAIDRNGNGYLESCELLRALTPSVKKVRRGMVENAFRKLDRNRKGYVSYRDLQAFYDVSVHTKYKNGEWTESDAVNNFLGCFVTPGDEEDGVIYFEEFFIYYAGLSTTCESDVHFDLIIRNAYKL